MALHIEEYKKKTGTKNSRNIIRCNIFEAIATKKDGNKSTASKYKEMWSGDVIKCSDAPEFYRLYGYQLCIQKNYKKYKELFWKTEFYSNYQIFCAKNHYEKFIAAESISILVEDSWDAARDVIQGDADICWLKNAY